MTSSSFRSGPLLGAFRNTLAAGLGALCLVLAACGGSANAPPPPEIVSTACVDTTITQQPAATSVTAGQNASFTVVAAGTAPLTYKWQRNGVDIAGATSATYTFTTAFADSGAVFRAVVNNCVEGLATSNGATLTVTAAAPVLTITPQPANTSVVAGTQASFTVGGTCSSGTLLVQWQRGQSPTPTFANIAGATALTYTLTTAIGDSGAQFRANLSCSGQSAATSTAATLTVTPPGSVTLSLLPLVGLRDQAEIPSATGIDQDAADSFTFITGNRIKRLSADLLSIAPVAGQQFSGAADGAAAVASFNQPFALTHDAAGNVYVADSGNSTIRRIAPDGTVTTLAGLAGSSGTTDGTGAAARFDSPAGIALGPDGDLYVADRNSHLIRRVTTAGVVTTYAGSSVGYLDGAALTAKFNSPWGVAVAANGDVLIADTSNNRIRRIVRAGNVAGAVETLAGNGSATAASPDGVGTAAVIANPRAIVLRGNVLTVRDAFGLLRQIDLTSKAVTTLTGSRALGEGYADGTTTTARIRDTGLGLTGAPSGGFMLADDLAIRTVSAAGVIKTIAASAAQSTPTGTGVLVQLPFLLAINRQEAVAVDPAGNIVVADQDLNIVRRVGAGGVVTLAAGLVGSFGGSVDGIGSEAQFASTGAAIASDGAGVVYSTHGFGSVRRIGTNNATTLVAGSATNFGALDGNGAAARFNVPQGLNVGPSGDIFVSDTGNNAIRRIDAAGNVTTYAGVLGQSARVDGPIATARFQAPRDLGRGPDGSLYVLDSGAVRKIAADGSSVSTLAAVFQATKMAVDATTGTIYYKDPTGLYQLPSGGASALLIPNTAGNVVLGNSPLLPIVNAMAVLGPKQILIVSGGQLLVATLP